MKRLNLWQNQLLSFRGRYILIKHVLQSMPLYLLSATNPPASVINQLHKIFAKFFWASATGSRNKHWVSWENMCFPIEEGGIDFRSFHVVSKSLFAKLWWIFKTSTSSMWSEFMWNKYCKKFHPIMAKGKRASHVWRKMVEVREEAVHNIWWQVKGGNFNFWFDNWT